MPLFLVEKSVFKIRELVFNIFFFTTRERKELLITVRELTTKNTIIHRKLVLLEDFKRVDAHIEDLIMFIKDTFKAKADELFAETNTGAEGGELQKELWTQSLIEFFD